MFVYALPSGAWERDMIENLVGMKNWQKSLNAALTFAKPYHSWER
ncbi:hypothetical protein MNB_SUP05-SYMBIONT-5-678 [hydrothermal vent metagenome]|uniref:Uncharacterized protein n=1 Tax=hydrothermal vent metagenome TaxID=652676 RepID=A0A1W1E5D9_9ZZZZ